MRITYTAKVMLRQACQKKRQLLFKRANVRAQKKRDECVRGWSLDNVLYGGLCAEDERR